MDATAATSLHFRCLNAEASRSASLPIRSRRCSLISEQSCTQVCLFSAKAKERSHISECNQMPCHELAIAQFCQDSMGHAFKMMNKAHTHQKIPITELTASAVIVLTRSEQNREQEATTSLATSNSSIVCDPLNRSTSPCHAKTKLPPS